MFGTSDAFQRGRPRVPAARKPAAHRNRSESRTISEPGTAPRADETDYPLWVISGHRVISVPSPLAPRKRTRQLSIGAAAEGQKATSRAARWVPRPFSVRPTCATG
jgi:hypothetical protein